ncbi:MAG: phosphate signaling complex protein PhoU [Oscillospiraceae bacterium]|nr:phosphate signaling complex protein PhoU [Oscillospiraceae bacterium]
MRNRFDEQLQLLNRELIEMGALCEEAIAACAKALPDGDTALLARVAALDGEIDHKERTVETMCLKLLLQQQPVARDLRQISAALKMITDMERIGDQAADIAEIVGYLDGRADTAGVPIGDMARATIRMVTASIDAFVKRDTAMAEEVVAHDDVVDDLFDKIKDSIIEWIAARPRSGQTAIDLLMIAKYFERIGDHAVNIAEWVIFAATGVHKGTEEL